MLTRPCYIASTSCIYLPAAFYLLIVITISICNQTVTSKIREQFQARFVQNQEPMSRSMQLHYIPVTAFS